MVALYSLIKGLQVDEIRCVSNALKKTESFKDEAFLMHKLFNAVSLDTKNANFCDEQLSSKLYQSNNAVAFSKLKSRLFQFILDNLSSDKVICQEHLFDASDRQIIRIRKKMLQFRILYRKKNRADITVLYHLLNEILKGAKEYEQYDIVIESLYFKKYLVMIRKGFDEIKNMTEQITYYEYARKAVLKANDYYFDLITNQSLIQKNDSNQILLMLSNAIKDLEVFIDNTNSALIKYVYKILCLEQKIRLKAFDGATDICFDIIKLLKNNNVLYRKERMGFVLDNISLCFVFKEDFESAASTAHQAQSYYDCENLSYLFSMQQEFYACFYGEKYEDALKISEKMLSFKMINKGEFRHDKYRFFNACTLFKLNQTKEALTICNQVIEITKDKGRWDLGMRYFKLMCLFEMGDCNGATNSLEALRKILNRIKVNGKLDNLNRDELIYKAFNEFIKRSNNNSSTSKLKQLIQKLSEKSETCGWNYYSHEIIPVHSWMESILKRKIIGKNIPV